MSYYVVSFMKGVLRCQIAEIVDVMSKDGLDQVMVFLLNHVIKDVITIEIGIGGMIEVMLWEDVESLQEVNTAHIRLQELGKTIDMIDIVINIVFNFSILFSIRNNILKIYTIRCELSSYGVLIVFCIHGH